VGVLPALAGRRYLPRDQFAQVARLYYDTAMTGPTLPERLRDAGLSAWELGDLLGIHPHLVISMAKAPQWSPPLRGNQSRPLLICGVSVLASAL
jgi:hypothetical protein